MLKTTIYILYSGIIICMAGATIIEKYLGTGYVSANIYGSWWFATIWAVLTAVAITYFIARRVRRPATVALHASFVLILAGALLTHATSWNGVIHLREGEYATTYTTDEHETRTENILPFSIRMDKFSITYHEGTEAVSDYRTDFTITSADTSTGHGQKGFVSMNNIYNHNGIRLYQSSYDEDGKGSYLSVNADTWGIPVTYTGYALLFISLIWMLVDPNGTFRKLLRSDMLRKGTLISVITLATLAFPITAEAGTYKTRDNGNGLPPTLPRETARQFGRMYMLYNDRVCPVQTFALDFTKKLCGHTSYKGLTAEQVLTGFILWGNEWSNEPVIKLKNGPLRETLQLPAQCSVNTFFNDIMGGYILGPYVRECYEGNNDKFHRDVETVDERLQIIMQLRQGSLLKMFPYNNDITKWYAPTDRMPAYMELERKEYIHNIFAVMKDAAACGNIPRIDETILKIRKYQMRYGGSSVPSDIRVKAERIYNAVPFSTILFMTNITIGIIAMVLAIFRMARNMKTDNKTNKSESKINLYLLLLLIMSFAALSVCLILRWIISGTIPMSNGYETMLLMAWQVMLLAITAYRHFRISVTFGFLLSGFFLLVSHISQMDPQITHIMPVLASPLLSIHVSVIMMGFAMLSMTFICGITAIALYIINRMHTGNKDMTNRNLNSSLHNITATPDSQLASLRMMSMLFLYPALAALGLGIFIGAIWANISWGNYWSWDPKEVWALITFMIYAIPLHRQSVPAMRSDIKYHIFISMAFLTILMTYFGVNYFLGGMHSYA